MEENKKKPCDESAPGPESFVHPKSNAPGAVVSSSNSTSSAAAPVASPETRNLIKTNPAVEEMFRRVERSNKNLNMRRFFYILTHIL